MASKGYGQFCPVAQAAEILAERWTPLVLREILCGSRRFNDLRRGVPTMSPSLLSRRLSSLADAGIVERRATNDGGSVEYHPTRACEELQPIIELLGVWGRRWARRKLSSDDLDASLLMWDIHRRIDPSQLPERERCVVEFAIAGAARGMRRWWLVVKGDDVDLCLQPPGFEVDVSVESDLRTLTEIWAGDRGIREAQRSGTLRLDGRRDLVRSFPKWFTLSVFAGVERAE